MSSKRRIESMKHKYMIPLVLCGLMIACTAPAFAATHDITSGSSQKIESELLYGPLVVWVSTNCWTNPGIHTGDQITWKDYRLHNTYYQPTQDAVSYSTLNNQKLPTPDTLSFGDEAYDQITRTAISGSQTLSIWHKWEGCGIETPSTVYIT